MIDIQLDPTTWDLMLTNGDLTLVSGADAIEQHIIQRLKLYRGEWFLDLSQGVPWFQDVLVKNPNPILVDGVIKDEILGVPGVIELTAFELDYDGVARTLTVNFTVRTEDGPVESSVQLGG